MKRRTSLLVTLLVCAAAQATDPPPRGSGQLERAANVAAAAASPVSSTPAEPAKPSRPPLDLRIGDVRKYMTPEEFRAIVSGNEERNTVLVEADRPLLPMKFEEPVPGGLIAPFWALANPLQAWRIFVPDLTAPPAREPADKIPPPVFRWGP
jgi:hypothetical protein